MIVGFYRRDEAHDPEIFAAGLAAVLGDYPREIVEYAVDPRTGIITGFKLGLPNVGQIKEFLDVAQERQERLARYQRLPKFERSAPAPLKRTPPGESFEEMFAKHGRPQGRFEGPEGYVAGARATQTEREKQQIQERFEAANRACFDAECRAAGLAPREQTISPSLMRELNAGWGK